MDFPGHDESPSCFFVAMVTGVAIQIDMLVVFRPVLVVVRVIFLSQNRLA